MTAPPVCVETDLHLRQTAYNDLTWRHPPRVPATLRWTADDPWAVHLEFTGTRSERTGAPVTWALGWEMLDHATRLGGRREVGDGDVRIRRTDPHHYELTLASPAGTATFTADPFDLAAFVETVRPRQRRAAATHDPIPATADELLAAIQAAHEETR